MRKELNPTMDESVQAEQEAAAADDEEIEPSSRSSHVLPLLTFIALLVLWQVASVGFEVEEWILPSPTAIVMAAVDWSDELWLHVLVTLYETLAGFALAIAVGIPLAIAVVYSPILQNTIYPILLAFQSVPKVAIAPLLVLWVGFGELPKILVVFLVCFFPIIVSTATGLNAVPPSLMDLIRSLSATQLQTFVKIRFPTAMPHIFVGLKVAITFAVIGAVIGEFVGSEQGLGYIILISTAQSKTPLAFAALVLLTVMSIALYYVVEALERVLVPWASNRS